MSFATSFVMFSALGHAASRLEGRVNLSNLTSKKLWLRINRVLAWALIVSPALQIMLDSALVPGLILDLVILLVHGGLSVWLFGLPKSPKGDDGTMHWIGIREARMSPRNRFLLSGWRLMISTLYLLAIPLAVAAGSLLPGLPSELAPFALVLLVLIIPINFFSLMWPYAMVTHVFGASGYALRRWGALGNLGKLGSLANGSAVTPWVSGLIVLVFVVASIANLFKSIWS